MKPKPYKARTLKGAEREVNRLRRELAYALGDIRLLNQEAGRMKAERNLMARLAARHQFNNPLEAMAAKTRRDEILRELGMVPDGEFLKPICRDRE